MDRKEKKLKYVDGRPLPDYRVESREELLELGKLGAIPWEFGAFTEQANASPGCAGRSWENEYLYRQDKIKSSELSLLVYEDYCKSIKKDIGIDNNSKVIEFGCALGRNLIVTTNKYDSYSVGIDINQEVVDKCNKAFEDRGEFYKVNLRNLEFLKKIKDDEFDLGVSDGFLMCIAAGEFKRNLLSEMIRVCKGLWIHETSRAPEYDYEIMNSVQSGEDLKEFYDDRLVVVKHTLDHCHFKDDVFYTPNRPNLYGDHSKARFYVFRK